MRSLAAVIVMLSLITGIGRADEAETAPSVTEDAPAVNAEADESAPEAKTMTRSEDPVVISASALEAMQGAEIASLTLLALGDDGLQPIPFQVDEKDEQGLFIYPEGEEANPEALDGKYTGEDELVFMAWDSGNRAPEETAWPCKPVKALELELEEPEGDGQGWVYLLQCTEAAPRSKTDYVINEFDGTRDWVKTDRYRFAERRGESYFDRLALRGKDGQVGENLADRIKGRGHIEVLGGLIDIDIPESDAKAGIKGWIDGPVRVIHLMQGMMSFAYIEFEVGGRAENLFYPNYFVTPINVDTPISPGSVLHAFTMRYTIDWRKGMEGARYYDPVNTQGTLIDGKMSKAEENLDFETSHDWYALTGEMGNLMVRIMLPFNWNDVVPIRLWYVDDAEEPEEPEDDPGQRCFGFYMDKMLDIEAGAYTYKLYYMVPEQAPPASVPQMLAMIDSPLEVEAEEIDLPGMETDDPMDEDAPDPAEPQEAEEDTQPAE